MSTAYDPLDAAGSAGECTHALAELQRHGACEFFRAGHRIASGTSSVRTLHLLAHGSAVVKLDNDIDEAPPLARLIPGDFFDEQGSAGTSLYADTDCTVISIPYARLRALCQAQPLLTRPIAALIARRVASAPQPLLTKEQCHG